MKKFLKLTVLAISCAVLTACGNLSDVSDKGTTDNPVFPKLSESVFNHEGSQVGSWVNWNNVRQIERGMNKDQLYNLIGRPHFSEGLYGVREWDYAFNYRENGVHKICQYKVLFDKNMNAQQFYWYPNGCNSDHEFNISADFLFDFDKDNLTAQGKIVVAELAEKLKSIPATQAIVEGHTDRMGSVEYNLDLSQRRANTVKAELQRLGVTTDLTAVGLGKAHQVKHCDGNNDVAKECLRPNRRVVLKVSGKTLVADSGVREAGFIGPAPLYDDKYPYSPMITGNPYPEKPAMNLQ
ncbi:plastocyanin [Pasteurellaceae bacterium 15-036681]|nr:plastocyanin [Pasteurellaceae bacterium 15-036681]